MAQLETLSTGRLSPRRKIEFWNDIASATFSPLVSDPVDRANFTGLLTRSSNSLVRMAEVYSDPQIVRHTRSQVAHTDEHVHFVHVQLDGESVNRQDQREARLMPGDITICDNSRPYDIVFEKPNRMLVMGFSDELVRRYIRYPQSISALKLEGQAGIGGLLSDFLQMVWRRCQEDKEFEVDSSVTEAMLGLIADAYRKLLGSGINPSSLGAAHRARIVNFIEEHLGDLNLTPTHIAEMFRITTRYLHHLFSGQDETVARYILRRRLEECARALASPSQSKRTITSIAFDHGFSSVTHFGRVFRGRYDLTPREYRQKHGMPM